MIDLVNLVEQYKSKGYSFTDLTLIKSGKEATVYRTEGDNIYLALKVYVNPKERAFKNNEQYLEGKFYKQHSVRKAITKGNKFAKKLLHTSWVKREYSILKHLQELGVSVPKIYDWTPDSILMEFIGDEGVPAPRLIDITLEDKDVDPVLESVLKTVKSFLDVGIVHSDLSAYNILWWKGEPFIIDFPQAIDIRQNPNKDELLKRDINNVVTYFSKYKTIDINAVYKRFDL